jgi:hypothetical protein
MDEERYETEKTLYKHFRYPNRDDEEAEEETEERKPLNYRLLQDDEVPEYIKRVVKNNLFFLQNFLILLFYKIPILY